MLLENYGQPLEKIPTDALSLSRGSSALQVDPQAKTVQDRDVLADEFLSELQTALKSANAIRLSADSPLGAASYS
jgi:hypothetical protein